MNAEWQGLASRSWPLIVCEISWTYLSTALHAACFRLHPTFREILFHFGMYLLWIYHGNLPEVHGTVIEASNLLFLIFWRLNIGRSWHIIRFSTCVFLRPRSIITCLSNFRLFCVQNFSQLNLHAMPLERLCLSMWRTTSCFKIISELSKPLLTLSGPGSSVGIETDFGLDGPVSNPGGYEIFRPSRQALGPTQPPCKMGTGSFPGVKCGRGVLLTTHPF